MHPKPWHSHFLLAVIFVIAAAMGQAQQLQFKHLNESNGLPSMEIYGVHCDKKGYVWAFTEYGIVRHNGERFVPSAITLPFEKSTIYAHYESPEGKLYIINSKGELYYLRKDTAIPVLNVHGKRVSVLASGNVPVYSLFVEKDSIIYVTSVHNICYKTYIQHDPLTCYYDAITRSDTIKFIERGKNFISVNILPDSFRYKGFNLTKAVITLAIEKEASAPQFFRLAAAKGNPIVRTLLQKKSHFLFLSYGSNLFIIDTLSGKYRSIHFPNVILCFDIDDNMDIWIGGLRTGLSVYDIQGEQKAHYFDNDLITGITFDTKNGVWVSSQTSGVYYCQNKKISKFDHIPELNGIEVTHVKKQDTVIIAGTSHGNVFIIGPNSLARTSAADMHLFHDNTDIKASLLIRDKLYIAGKPGIFALHYPSLKPYAHSSYEVGVLDLLALGDTGYFTGFRNIGKFSFEHFDTASIELKTLKRSTTMASIDPNTILVGGNMGVYATNAHTLKTDQEVYLENVYVQKLYPHKGFVWLCTKGSGLLLMDKNFHTMEINRVPSNVTNDIKILGDTLVLLSTNKGLFIARKKGIDLLEWKKIYDLETHDVDVLNGTIYAGTKTGLITINLSSVTENEAVPFYLKKIVVDNRVYRDTSKLIFNYNQNHLIFHFDVLNYENNSSTLTYTLHGSYNYEAEGTERSIELQNLLPGDYTLTVSSSMPNEQQAQNHLQTFRFCILPAFWQTEVFLIEMIVLALILIVSIFIISFRRLRKRERARAAMERLLAEHKLTALKAQINPHFISNCLTAVQQLIFENEVDRASQYIAKFSLFIRQVLKHSDKSIVPLEEEISLIDLNIELEQLRFENKFQFEKHLDPEVDLYETYIPPLITQPLIENAIWHGLLPLKNGRIPTLTLRITNKDNYLVIEIEDNGVGRNSGSKDRLPNHESKGISLVKNRIENLNKLYPDQPSSVDVIDVLDKDHQPAGTRIIIHLPNNL